MRDRCYFGRLRDDIVQDDGRGVQDKGESEREVEALTTRYERRMCKGIKEKAIDVGMRVVNIFFS